MAVHWKDVLREQLQRHESFRAKPYRCSAGKLTIGFGRNLDDRGITSVEAQFLLEQDIRETIRDLDRALPWWKELSNVRRRVLADMCFNMGLGRLLTFRKMLAALGAHDYMEAANEMEDSRWYHQVGTRAARLVLMMRTDHDA